MAINYTRTYPSSGWTSGTIAPSAVASTASYDQIKASLPVGATETDIIREATRLGLLPPAPVLTGQATPDQLRATEQRFQQIQAFLPGPTRARSGTMSRVAPSSGASSNPRSGGGNARSGMGVAQGRQGTAIAPGRGSGAGAASAQPVSSGWTGASVAPQQQWIPQSYNIGQVPLTGAGQYSSNIPPWLPERVQQLNSGQNFRTDLMGLLFGQGGGSSIGQGGSRMVDPLIAQGYNAAAQAAAGLQQQQTAALRQPQMLQDQLAYWMGQRAAINPGITAAGTLINPEVLRINAQIAALQQQLRGAQPLAQRAAGASSGWTASAIPTY